jgi:6-pyruvoyltetrahydropterin/6-carboxytetrahydropterin synthase
MPTMELSAIFHFAASHFLTKYHGTCEKLHGHNYKIKISIKGKVKNDGIVKDFKLIKEIYQKKIHVKLDHSHLNNLIDNPSVENIAIWIWQQLKNHLPLKSITIYETDNYYCKYEGK